MITLKINSQNFSFKSSFDLYQFIQSSYFQENCYKSIFQKYNLLILKRITSNKGYITYLLIDNELNAIMWQLNGMRENYGLSLKVITIFDMINNKIMSYRHMDSYIYLPFIEDSIYEIIPYDAKYRLYYKFIGEKHFKRNYDNLQITNIMSWL